jgi:hypothetical protein
MPVALIAMGLKPANRVSKEFLRHGKVNHRAPAHFGGDPGISKLSPRREPVWRPSDSALPSSICFLIEPAKGKANEEIKVVDQT